MSFAKSRYLVNVKPSGGGYKFIIYRPIWNLMAIRVGSGDGYSCEREAESAAWRLIGRIVPNR